MAEPTDAEIDAAHATLARSSRILQLSYKKLLDSERNGTFLVRIRTHDFFAHVLINV